MAVNIYDELAALAARVSALELAARHKLKLAPVTYFYPGPRWDATLAKAPALTIINPGSGPGTAISSTYVGQVLKAQALGVPVYGYIHTKYGTRPWADVKLDIDRHVGWYHIDGIFVDTTSNLPEHVPYYTQVSQYIRSLGRKVILNPGTKTIEAYAPLADHIMVSETDAVTYRTRTSPEWEARWPRDLFWHCVHTCSAADMPSIVDLARSRNCGLLYVTDDVMANPYDTLPTYWDALAAAVK